VDQHKPLDKWFATATGSSSDRLEHDAAPRPTGGPALVVNLELGYLDQDDNLSIEYTYQFVRIGSLESDNAKRKLIITDASLEVHVPHYSILRIHTLAARPAELLFSLSHAPLFASRGKDGRLVRECAIDGGHAKVGQVVNRQVVVTFRDGEECRRFCEADRRKSYPQPRQSNIQLSSAVYFQEDQMALIKPFMDNSPTPIAFQACRVERETSRLRCELS
jgi:hypothetical protein